MSYERILVPLDGSLIAEKAMEHALALAERFGCEIHLLRAVESPIHAGTGKVYERALAAADQEARSYLEGWGRRLAEQGLTVHAWVEPGHPAEAILERARQERMGLIVMASHGRNGFQRWLLGRFGGR